jgi:hypothetical protein
MQRRHGVVLVVVCLFIAPMIMTAAAAPNGVVATSIDARPILEAADFDNDGDGEIVSGDPQTDTITFFDPRANVTRSTGAPAADITALDVGDVDGDAAPEAVAQYGRTGTKGVFVFQTQSNTLTQQATIGSAARDGRHQLVVGDFVGGFEDDILTADGKITDVGGGTQTTIKSVSGTLRLYDAGEINTTDPGAEFVSQTDGATETNQIRNRSGVNVQSLPDATGGSVANNPTQAYIVGNATPDPGKEVIFQASGTNNGNLTAANASSFSGKDLGFEVNDAAIPLAVGSVGDTGQAVVGVENAELQYGSVDPSDGVIQTSVSTASGGTIGIRESQFAVADVAGDSRGDIIYVDPNREVAIYSEPGDLSIRNASAPNNLVTSATVDVSFVDSSQTVVRETTSNGVVDLSAAPPATPLRVQVNAPGFQAREITIDSLIQQQSIFLLPQNATEVTIDFELRDNTGKFPSPETDLILQRPFNRSGSTEFERVRAGVFGASNTKTVVLEEGVRYRVAVRNENGEIRQLGPIIPRRSERIPLEVGQLEFGVSNESTFQFNASRSDDTLTTVYQDPDEQTSEVTLRFRELNNKSNVVASTQIVSPGERAKFTHQLQGSKAQNQSYVAVFEATRGGEVKTGQEIIGVDRFPLNTGLESGWQQIFATALILVVGGLFSAGNARIGALVVPGLGGVLFYIGWLDGVAGGATVVLALALGAGYNLVTTRGVPA